MVMHAKQARCTTITLEEQTQERSETKAVQQSVKLSITGPPSDKWDASGMSE